MYYYIYLIHTLIHEGIVLPTRLLSDSILYITNNFFDFGALCHFVNEENTVRVFETILIICKLVAIGKCWIHPIKENST